MCTIKEFLQLNNYNLNFREAVAHILEQYYEVGLDEIPLQLESIYDKKKLVAFYDGNYITIDPIASTLSECNIGKILAHELAHYFQWKELSNPSNRSIFLDWLMEKEAGEAEEDFKAIYYGVSPKENKYKLKKKSWGNVEKYFNAKVPFCQKAKYKISAYGIGGFFTVKQVLMDKIGAKDGIDVEHEGCHEKLTRLAYEKYVARDATKKRKIDDKNLDSLITGARMNDFYFFGNLHESVYDETVKNILNNRDAILKKCESIIDSNKRKNPFDKKILEDAETIAHDNFSKVSFNFFLDTSLEMAVDALFGFLDLANFVNKYADDEKIKIGKIIKDAVKGLFVGLPENPYVDEYIKEIIDFVKKENENLLGKTFQIKKDLASTIDELLNKVGIKKVIKDSIVVFINEGFDLLEKPSQGCVKFDREVNDFFINKEEKISNALDALMNVLSSECGTVEGAAEKVLNGIIINPVNSVIGVVNKGFDLLNVSLGSSKENFEKFDDISIETCKLLNEKVGFDQRKQELEKFFHGLSSLYCFIQFIMNSHFGGLQFLHSMDCSNGNSSLNMKKCVRFAEFCVSVYHNEDKNGCELRNMKFGDYINGLPEGDVLKEMFYPLLVPIMTLSAAKYDVKKRNTTGSLFSILEQKYNSGEKSYFSQITVEEFFSMKLIKDEASKKELDYGWVALGMACHMIEDSFTASHTIRAWNINGRKEIKEDADLKGLPPILYCADYKEQSSGRHVYSDLFVNDLSVDDSENMMSVDGKGNMMSVDGKGNMMSVDGKGKEVKTVRNKLKKQVDKKNVQQTLNASIAKDCTSLFLEKVFKTSGKKADYWNILDAYLYTIYSNIENVGSNQNVFRFSLDLAFPEKAGRSYECDDVLKKDGWIEKHREKCNRLVQTKKVPSWAESIPEKLDELHKYFYKENDVQACWFYGNWLVKLVELYRSYLINNYAKCVYPSTHTVDKNKKDEEEFFDSITGKLMAAKTEKFYKDFKELKNESSKEMINKGKEKTAGFTSDEDIENFRNRFGEKKAHFDDSDSNLDQKLIWLYKNFDLAYIEKIFAHTNYILNKIKSLKDMLRQEKKNESIYKVYYIYVNEIILYCIGTIKRYRGHLYEMKANIAWIVCVKQQSLSLYQQIDDLIKRFPEVEEKVCTSIKKSIEEGLAALQ